MFFSFSRKFFQLDSSLFYYIIIFSRVVHFIYSTFNKKCFTSLRFRSFIEILLSKFLSCTLLFNFFFLIYKTTEKPIRKTMNNASRKTRRCRVRTKQPLNYKWKGISYLQQTKKMYVLFLQKTSQVTLAHNQINE